jgi:hypothetical protein
MEPKSNAFIRRLNEQEHPSPLGYARPILPRFPGLGDRNPQRLENQFSLLIQAKYYFLDRSEV